MVAHDALVLAGGAGRRMGGTLKAQVELRGRRLLDHVLDATAQARSVVVVAPATVPVPDGVTRTLEDPPLGGPVAGVGAGLAAVPDPAPWLLLLACDVPGAAAGVPRLLAAAAQLGDGDAPDVDGLVLRDDGGRDQWLLGVYRSDVLRARVSEVDRTRGLRGCPVRELLAPLRLRSLVADAAQTHDVDTWADLDAAEQRRP